MSLTSQIRDYMALPYDPRDWTEALVARSGKLGLLIEIGAALTPQPAVRRAIEAAAKTFEEAGAVVEPVGPFVTDEMLDGLDLFFQSRLLAEIERLPSNVRARFCLSYSRGAAGQKATVLSMQCARLDRSC